ncbi:hypothetical protein CR513_46367, partial [Mucuna pruriens]
MSPYRIVFKLRLEAYENSRIYKEKIKQFHDSRNIRKEFRVNQKVLLFNSRLKLIAVEIRDDANNRNFKINGHQLKPYYEGPNLSLNVGEVEIVELIEPINWSLAEVFLGMIPPLPKMHFTHFFFIVERLLPRFIGLTHQERGRRREQEFIHMQERHRSYVEFQLETPYAFLGHEMFYIPAMNVLSLTNSTTQSLGRLSKLESKEHIVCPRWKLEFNIPFHFKPPSLLKISNYAESVVDKN